MALDTFNPYLFVSAGEQSNKFLTPNYADGIAKFQAQRAQQVTKLLVQIDPVQDLNGQANPYPPGGGKNKLENTAQTATQSGVTFTVNEDGTVSTSGTSTEDANYIVLGVMTLPAGDYVLSGCPSGGSASTFYIIINSGSTASSDEGDRVATDTGSGAEFTLSEATEICVWMACDNGQVMNNKVFKPMIRLASVTDGTYAPYSNICPITGWTGMTVTACGSNLLNIQPQSGTVSGVSYVVDNDGYITLNGTAGAGCNIYLQTHIAPFNSKVTISSDKVMPSNVYAGLVQQNGNSGLLELRPGDTTRTSGESGIAEESRYRMYIVPGVTLTNFKYRPMLNYGAVALPYAPYNATTYPITWQTEAGTIYGGTLDVVSGVLTVDRAIITLDGTEQWNIMDNIVGCFDTASIQTNPPYPDTVCDTYKNVVSYNTLKATNSSIALGGTRLMVHDDRFSTVADFISNLAANPIHVAYPLATPTTYQLDPEEVQTLAGYNQIYSDAGPVIDIQF